MKEQWEKLSQRHKDRWVATGTLAGMVGVGHARLLTLHVVCLQLLVAL